MWETLRLLIRQDFGCFPKRAGDYRLKRFNGVSWVETSAKAYNAYLGDWKEVNGYIFIDGERFNFYGSMVEPLVQSLEERGIAMNPGVSTWDDVFSDSSALRKVLASDASVAALLDDTILRNEAKKDSRILSAIKNYGTFGKAALTHIKNSATLKNEFIAISSAYSNTSDFKYLLTCESCNSTGSVKSRCSTCGGDNFIRGGGDYFKCDQCGYIGRNPDMFANCYCGNSISSGYYVSMIPCPTCNAEGKRDYYSVYYVTQTCSSCGGKGCHF